MMSPTQSRRPHNHWSKAVSLLLRLAAVMLAVGAAGILGSSSCEGKAPDSGDVIFTYTYTHFGAFVFFIGCGITATILEGAAIYLQSRLEEAAAAANKTVMEREEQEEEQGTTAAAAATVLLVVDLLVPFLLFSGTGAAYLTSKVNKVYRDNIGACTVFSSQVEMAEMLSLAACIAAVIAFALVYRLN